MEGRIKSLNNKFLYNKKTLQLSLILVPISFAAGLAVVKKLKYDFTLLGPYGDFFAGTTVPILTFVSFLAVIMTLNQQYEQLELQKKEIEENRKVNYQDSLPNRIINLEESIDIIKKNISELNSLDKTDVIESLSLPIYQQKLNLFILDGNYNLSKREEIINIIESDLRKIRNKLVLVNTQIYKLFIDFQRNIDDAYTKNITNTENEFHKFCIDKIDENPIAYALMHEDMDGKFAETHYTKEDYDRLNAIKSNLRIYEKQYLTDLYSVYHNFRVSLEHELSNLVSQLA